MKLVFRVLYFGTKTLRWGRAVDGRFHWDTFEWDEDNIRVQHPSKSLLIDFFFSLFVSSKLNLISVLFFVVVVLFIFVDPVALSFFRDIIKCTRLILCETEWGLINYPRRDTPLLYCDFRWSTRRKYMIELSRKQVPHSS